MIAVLVLVALAFVAATAVVAAVIGSDARAIRREDRAAILTSEAPDRAARRARHINGLHVRGTHGASVSGKASFAEAPRIRKEKALA
jgi:hypothetical protein